jgi:hypothetical protein
LTKIRELNQPLILPYIPHIADIAALASKVVELQSKIVLISALLKV